MKRGIGLFILMCLLTGVSYAEGAKAKSTQKQEVPFVEFPIYLHGSGLASKEARNTSQFEAQRQFVELYLIPLGRVNDSAYVADINVRLNLANIMRRTDISVEKNGFGGVETLLTETKGDLDTHFDHLKTWVNQGVIIALVGDAGAQVKASGGYWQLPTVGPYNQQSATLQFFTSAAKIFRCGSQESCSFLDDFPMSGSEYDALRTWANDTSVSTNGYGDALGGRALVRITSAGSQTLWAEIFDKETGETKRGFKFEVQRLI